MVAPSFRRGSARVFAGNWEARSAGMPISRRSWCNVASSALLGAPEEGGSGAGVGEGGIYKFAFTAAA